MPTMSNTPMRFSLACQDQGHRSINPLERKL
jgi:hypothetical protein